MDNVHYQEMIRNLEKLSYVLSAQKKKIYLFGHCNASEELIDILIEKGYEIRAILDNNIFKYGITYKDIPVVSPNSILKSDVEKSIVCIAARSYESMAEQLREMGYKGPIIKMVDYNSYAEYSLSKETIEKKRARVERGIGLIKKEKEKYPGCYRIYCPFSALGDVYYAMAYLPYFLERKLIKKYVVFTIGNSCAEVAKMFGAEYVEAISQRDMDESIQAVLFTEDADAYIPHQDRPYVVKLAKALYIKKIPLELIYKCGVYGLDRDCVPYKPVKLDSYRFLDRIIPGKAVVLSPYAKSVTNISSEYWKKIIKYYKEKNYQIFTNVFGEEQELEETQRLDVKLSELQSVVERAGTFIGIRSGLCDVLQEAQCRKIALYPDCCYSDTKWKMEEIYHLDSFENLVVSQKI